MRRLAIIPNDPIDLYLTAGYSATWLKKYFNPNKVFDEVYSLSPYEQVDGEIVGVIPRRTPAQHLHRAIRELDIQVVRAYGGFHPCEIACENQVNGVPVVVSVHDMLPELLHPSIARADVVICVSDVVRKLVLTRFQRLDRVWMLPNRVDFTVMRPRSPHETEDLTATYPFKYPVLHVGRRNEAKNLDNLIRALRILGPDYCVIATGRGPLEPYKRIASEEGVLERCFFLDSIANEELPRYFSWARCMCNPSRHEAMSIALIEALASGAVLVTSDIPAISETVHDGENGLLVKEVEDPGSIAAAVCRACTDEGVRQTLKANARRSVEQFEQSRIDALEAGYYEKVLELRAAGAFRRPVGTRIRGSIGRVARNRPSELIDGVVEAFDQQLKAMTATRNPTT
jgi:glycosyltransferase involved in cell wall biosynthesis